MSERVSSYDSIYNTVDRDDFESLIDVDRYADRTDAFDQIISATEEHFWDPTDPRYVDFDASTLQFEHAQESKTIRVIEPFHCLDPVFDALIDDPRLTEPMCGLTESDGVSSADSWLMMESTHQLYESAGLHFSSTRSSVWKYSRSSFEQFACVVQICSKCLDMNPPSENPRDVRASRLM